MQSDEQAPEPTALMKTEPPPPAMAPEPAISSDEAAEPATPKSEPAAEESTTPQVHGAEASVPANGGDVGKFPSSSPSMAKERQIPVDPASLRRLGMVADEDSPLSAPSVLTEVVSRSSPLLPPLRRPTFVGASLPCSAVSSPVHAAKWDEQQQPAATTTHSPTTSALRSLARQHSAALARLVAAPPPSTLSRSTSRAEGRTIMASHHDDEEDDGHGEQSMFANEDGGFTCGALCMFIPGFSRKKPSSSFAAAATSTAVSRQSTGLRPRRSGVSRVASLERFECGSWSPPTTAAAECLATEVAKMSCAAADDAEAPVKMAFVFDGETTPTTKGILKNSASSRLVDSARPSMSSSSQRHVRFSTAVAGDVAAAAASCPTSPCITPRLARARAEFDAFLEAQSA